jgi:hypothetical protein
MSWKRLEIGSERGVGCGVLSMTGRNGCLVAELFGGGSRFEIDIPWSGRIDLVVWIRSGRSRSVVGNGENADADKPRLSTLRLAWGRFTC